MVKVYQIGLGSFGRYGFEKLVEMHNHLEEVDVSLEGLCDRDFDRLEKAEKFAEANEVNVKTFHRPEQVYREASKHDAQVLIYDAGPTETHSRNIYRSMRHGFFHLAEKPPSMNRGQHINEKRLAAENNAMWKVDFIERENPVVKKALELVEGEELEKIKVFRESSAGIEKMIAPAERYGVKGGDILDKMVHEVYVLDFLEKTGSTPIMELEDAESRYFMPKEQGSEKMLSIDGGYTESINYNTSTGQTKASFNVDETRIDLYSSWLGLSQDCMVEAKNIHRTTGASLLNRDYSEINDQAFIDEEARFFTLKGTVNLAGDMLHGKLYDLDSGEEVETDYYLHDQLYRVIRKAVLKASGRDVDTVSEKETDIFMNAIFDVKEEVAKGDIMEELEKTSERFESLVVRDGKVLEAEGTDVIAG